jgi:predicted aspartyl protease
MSKTALLLCGVLCIVAFLGANVQPQMQAPAEPRFERGDSVAVPGVEIFDRIIYLPVRVNGAGPFTFVLDTGAGAFSAIDQSVADSLGMRSQLIAKGGGAGEDVIDINRVDSVVVSCDGLSFEPRLLMAIPLHRMDPHWGKRKDGLVGGDLLSTLVTRIDYERGTVTFHNAASYEYSGPGERIPMQVYGNHIFVSADVFLYEREEPVEALLMLDTGVRITTFNNPFSRVNGLAAQSPATVQGVTGFGLGGVSRGIVGRVRGIGIGSIFIENPVVDFSTDERGALADTSFSGIIGADILSRFTVVFDYARERMFLEKNSSFGEPSEFEMSGIRFVMEGKRFDVLKVFSVFEGSPAAEAGIEPGDIVTTIDGRAASSFTREALRVYMEREGAEVKLTVSRGAATREIALRLRRLV